MLLDRMSSDLRIRTLEGGSGE
jgi:hypothetical protein